MLSNNPRIQSTISIRTFKHSICPDTKPTGKRNTIRIEELQNYWDSLDEIVKTGSKKRKTCNRWKTEAKLDGKARS